VDAQTIHSEGEKDQVSNRLKRKTARAVNRSAFLRLTRRGGNKGEGKREEGSKRMDR